MRLRHSAPTPVECPGIYFVDSNLWLLPSKVSAATSSHCFTHSPVRLSPPVHTGVRLAAHLSVPDNPMGTRFWRMSCISSRRACEVLS